MDEDKELCLQLRFHPHQSFKAAWDLPSQQKTKSDPKKPRFLETFSASIYSCFLVATRPQDNPVDISF